MRRDRGLSRRGPGRAAPRRGRAAKLAALGAAAAGAYWSPTLSSVVPGLRAPLGVRDHLVDRGRVALTFDDGPHPEGTPAVLAWLEQAGVRATFFLVGEQVERWPGPVARIAAAGHTIGLHAYRHDLLPRLGPWRLSRDLDAAVEVIQGATGVPVRFCRAPLGIPTMADLVLARRYGRELVHWARWGRDWEAQATPESIAALATKDLQGGEILLLHDADHYSAAGSWRRTAAALPLIRTAVEGRGLGFGAL